jgi:hypothetical protein
MLCWDQYLLFLYDVLLAQSIFSPPATTSHSASEGANALENEKEKCSLGMQMKTLGAVFRMKLKRVQCYVFGSFYSTDRFQ